MADDTIYKRIEALRQWMIREQLDGYLIHTDDEFFNEEPAPDSKRLQWLTGFTGSYGEALILKDHAIFFADGRYTERAAHELLPQVFQVVDPAQTRLSHVIEQHVKNGQRIGIFPWTTTCSRMERLHDLCHTHGVTLVETQQHPVDLLWKDRPPRALHPLIVHPIQYAGKAFTDKLNALRTWMIKKQLDIYVMAAPGSISWLLNIRSQDCGCAPFPFCRALIPQEGPLELYISPRPGYEELKAHFGNQVVMAPEEAFSTRLTQLTQQILQEKLRIGFDPEETPAAVETLFRHSTYQFMPQENPVLLPRAYKNPTEQEGARHTHWHDGLALIRAYAWISRNVGKINEWDVSLKLAEMRAKSPLYISPSFTSIVAFGPHNSMAHYTATPETALPITNTGGLLMIDSGGHYWGGTTDVTRTFAISPPTPEQKDRYTRVLKGHIGLAMCVFPENTKGWQFDTIARYHLWQAGLDYRHGTGHGVGSFGGVHEGPICIGSSTRYPHAFDVGTIVSNEPAYYKAGHYGMRIENLMMVTPSLVIEEASQKNEGHMLCFETLTLVPYDTRLMDTTLLTTPEKDWINTYHQRIWNTFKDHISSEEQAWLKDATQVI